MPTDYSISDNNASGIAMLSLKSKKKRKFWDEEVGVKDTFKDKRDSESQEFYSNDIDKPDVGFKKIFADSENKENDEIKALARGMTLADIRKG